MEKKTKLEHLANNPFWRRWQTQAFLGLLAFGMAIALGSYAVDSGSLLQWALTLFWLLVACKLYLGLVARLFRKRGQK